MTSTQERTMEANLNQSHVQDWQAPQGSGVSHYIDKQRLRILRCTAKAMASSPGGLRFKAGTRPWLDGLASGLPVLPAVASQRGSVVSQAAGG